MSTLCIWVRKRPGDIESNARVSFKCTDVRMKPFLCVVVNAPKRQALLRSLVASVLGKITMQLWLLSASFLVRPVSTFFGPTRPHRAYAKHRALVIFLMVTLQGLSMCNHLLGMERNDDAKGGGDGE